MLSRFFSVRNCFDLLTYVMDWQDDLQGRISTGSPTTLTPPPGISSKLDRSPSVTPPEAWGGEPLERGGLRQPTMSRFVCLLNILLVNCMLVCACSVRHSRSVDVMDLLIKNCSAARTVFFSFCIIYRSSNGNSFIMLQLHPF